MAYRPFANNKTVTSSDYNAIIKLNRINIGKNNYANSSSKLLVLKKKKNTCYPATRLELCDEAPITLINGKTSYTCDNNTAPEHVCNSLPRILYPYGYYMCSKTNCNTCTNVAAILP